MAKITAVKVNYEPWAFKMERAHDRGANGFGSTGK